MDISRFTFVSGTAGDGKNTVCLNSMRALLDGRPFGDDHPSFVLRSVGIFISDGDWWLDDVERTRVLMPLALDERFCAHNCDTSSEAEQRRAEITVHWALSIAIPAALDSAAYTIREKYPDSAALLFRHAAILRREPTITNIRAAADVATVTAVRAADAADAADAANHAVANRLANAAVRAANAAVRAANAVDVVDVANAAIRAANAVAVVDHAADAVDAASVNISSYRDQEALCRAVNITVNAVDIAVHAVDDGIPDARKSMRDAMINLFYQLLDVRAGS